ncbi:MAG: SMC-Scp complex subunit ScpB [Planctomycetes bacterium]|nr:SMC-Scp complex subunit ScpB [Planctomycetota bacterium]
MPDPTNPVPPDPVVRDDDTTIGDVLSASSMPQEAMMTRIEALLFVHAKPISARRIADLLGVGSVIPVKQSLAALAARYDSTGSAMSIQELAAGYQLTTRPEHNDLLAQLVREREAQKLSPAALEVLAIIAYKQPLSRVDIESIRGAGSDHLMRALLDRGLVAVTERSNKPGAAALYGTTAEFLRAFGLKALGELPREGDLSVPDSANAGDAAVEQSEAKTPEE